jgi:release factor glutamine methyltransferase
VTFVNGDLLPDEPPLFDVIVANLPYIPSGEIAALSREVRHDPVAALDGGPDGLDLVRRLIESAKTRMNPGARMFLEIGHDQSEQAAGLFGQHGYSEPVITKDLQGAARFVSATAPPAA